MKLTKNKILFFLIQFFYMGTVLIGFASISLSSYKTAPLESLRTLPLTGTALFSFLGLFFVTSLIKKFSTKTFFLIGNSLGILSSLLFLISHQTESFFLLTLAGCLFGFYNTTAGFYKHTITKNCLPKEIGPTISFLLLGSVLATLLMPEFYKLIKPHYIEHGVIGSLSYVLMIAFSILSLSLLLCLEKTETTTNSYTISITSSFTLLKNNSVQQAILLTLSAQGLMIFSMNTLSLAMTLCGYPKSSIDPVIQWHIFAMFAPSLFSGKLINIFSELTLGLCGLFLITLGFALGISGQTPLFFQISAILSGLGWNFAIISATALLGKMNNSDQKRHSQILMEYGNTSSTILGSVIGGYLLAETSWIFLNTTGLIVGITAFLFLLKISLDKPQKINSNS